MHIFKTSNSDQENPAEPFWPDTTDPVREVDLPPYPNVPHNELDKAILENMQKERIVGISAAVVNNGKVAWANGYGWSNIEQSIPAKPTTIYRIASISKTITATALMQLWEAGKFDLDSDIGIYLGYPVRNPHYPDIPITFRMLLTHTSGLLDTGGYARAINSLQPPALQEILLPGKSSSTASNWAGFPPGSGYHYSNFGFGIIGCLIEILSGESFDRYTVNHIFKPLQMDASFVPADLEHYLDIAVLYEKSGNGKFYPACDYYPKNCRPLRKVRRHPLGNYYIGPAGAVRTSALDLAKFMLAHLHRGNYGGVRILQPATVEQMQQLQWSGYDSKGILRETGLGFQISDKIFNRRLTGHAGEACGLVSGMYFDRYSKQGIIFMVNGGYYRLLDSGYTGIEEALIRRLFTQST